MIRTLRAFMWLRWRLLVNGIRSGERRDALERVSRTIAVLAPMLMAALSAGSVVAVSVLGFIGGRATAGGLLATGAALIVVRIVLAALLALTVVITMLAPVQTMMGSYTRLLLLPIRRSTLHLIEVAANLTDPWIVVVVPGLLMFAVGLAVGGRLDMASAAAVAGVAMVFVLVSVGALVSFLLGWLLRSRRRGEAFTLVFVLAVSLVSIVPAFVSSNLASGRRTRATSGASAAPRPPSEPFSVDRFDAALPRWSRALPSELYGLSVRAAAQNRTGLAWLTILALALEGATIFAASAAVHQRLIGSLENEHERHRHRRSLRGFRLPWIGQTVAAVAMASAHSLTRSVRGRLAILLPGPLIIALSMLLRRIPDLPSGLAAVAGRGDLLFGAASILALHALQPFTMNLFGTDRAGLTLLFLSPVSDRDLARGKVLGGAVMLAFSMALCLVGAAIAAPGGDFWIWLAVPVGVASVYVFLMPAAVWFSAILPVAADLSKTGSRGNPHPIAMIAGLFLVMACLVPPALVIAAADFWFHRPVLAPLIMAAWLLLATLVAWPLLNLAAGSIGPRRENLALLSK